ncbi:hypothetical protein EV424DRAFT_1553543 [Suillus variegatus]|nr:hypothetical protein EV424DRAFT_1553543 [Suillus variegatus]
MNQTQSNPCPLDGFIRLSACHLDRVLGVLDQSLQTTSHRRPPLQTNDTVIVPCNILSTSGQAHIKFVQCYSHYVARSRLQRWRARDFVSIQKDVEQWLQEWDIFGEERSQFLKSIVDAFIQSGQPETAYHHTLSYVSSLPSSSPSPAIDAISLVLRLPSLLDFDPLFKLYAVVSTKDRELFSLLQVFLNSGLLELHLWLVSHRAALEKYELDRAQLERKTRLLSFASLGFAHVGYDRSTCHIQRLHRSCGLSRVK